MDKIFNYNWSGNDWDYRFQFFKASANPLSAPVEIELPPACLKWKSLKKGFKNRPLGIPSAESIEFTLNVSDIPLDFDSEIIDIVKNPVLSIAYSCNYSSRSITSLNEMTYNGQFNSGTCIKLQVSYEANNVWETVWVGALRGESGIQFDNSDMIITFTAVSIFKIINDNVEFAVLDAIKDINIFNKTEFDRYFVNDLTYQYNSKEYRIDHAPLPADITVAKCYQFNTRDFIFDFIEKACKKMYRYILRDESVDFTLEYIENVYFKQGNTAGTPGASLTSDQICIMTYDGVNCGLFNNKDDLSLSRKYNTSAWDFLKDYLTQSLAKCIFDYKNNKMTYAPIFGSHFPAKKIIVVDPTICNISSENSDAYVYKVASTFCDIWSDDKFKDLDKVEVIKNGAINENELSIPIYLNNIPTCVKYSINDKNNIKEAFSWYSHSTNLYYFTDNMTYNRFTRVHETVALKTDNTYIQEGDTIPYHDIGDAMNKPSELCSIIQAESGWGFLAAKKALQIFGDRELQEVTLEIPVDYGFDINEGWLLQFMDTVYYIDISVMDARVTETYKEFYPIEWEWDFEKEVIKLKLLQKRI